MAESLVGKLKPQWTFSGKKNEVFQVWQSKMKLRINEFEALSCLTNDFDAGAEAVVIRNRKCVFEFILNSTKGNAFSVVDDKKNVRGNPKKV